jgi:hypothetical protein
MSNPQESLKTIKSVLNDPKAFRGGKPLWKTPNEIHGYLQSKGFRLTNAQAMGPKGLPNGQQLIWEGPNNVIVKVKTRGYGEFPPQRVGVATMSIEATDGLGTQWENALYKVDSQGNVLAKSITSANETVKPLPPDHPARLEARKLGKPEPTHGVLNPKTNELRPITKFELIEGGANPKPLNKQAWADATHMNLPKEFDPAGADDLAKGFGKKPPPVPPTSPPSPASPAVRRLKAAKEAFKSGIKGAFSAENLASMIPEVILAFADRAAIKSAMRNIQIKFIKEGFARGVAAGVMGWNEEEVHSNLLNKVTHFRVQGMGDAAGNLKLPYILQLAENSENYAVIIGYQFAYFGKTNEWKGQLRAKGFAALEQHGYGYYFRQPPEVLFTYEFLDRLAWVLRPTSDPIIEPAIQFK